MKIHSVKGRFVNSYIIEEPHGLFVIDVAMRGGEKFVLGHLEEVLKRDPKDVKYVLCTHDDPDHIGGVHALARTCEAEVGMPFASRSLMLKNLNNPIGMVVGPTTIFVETFRPRMWSMYFNKDREVTAKEKPIVEAEAPGSLADRNLGADFLLYNKMRVPEFDDWLILHTPGHSWDSMCFYHEPSREVISGDTLLCSKKKNKVVMPAIYTNPFQMKRSIKKLIRLKPTAIHPAHGTSLFGDDLLDHLV